MCDTAAVPALVQLPQAVVQGPERAASCHACSCGAAPRGPVPHTAGASAGRGAFWPCSAAPQCASRVTWCLSQCVPLVLFRSC